MAELHQPASAAPVEPTLFSSFGEELTNAITHGLGALLSIAALATLVAAATANDDAWTMTSAIVFGTALVLMYTVSTLFHSMPVLTARRALRVADHSLIFVLIAGTYTPLALVTLHGPWGWSLFGFVWGLTALGIVFKLFYTGRFTKLSVFVYLFMGWSGIVVIVPLAQSLPTAGLIWLLAGGLCYCVGVVFYAFGNLRYYHAIWHLFVMAGSACHYICVLRYVLPSPLNAG